MKTETTSKNSTAGLSHHFNNHDNDTHWQQYTLNIIESLSVVQDLSSQCGTVEDLGILECDAVSLS